MTKHIKARTRYVVGPLARLPIVWPRDRKLLARAEREGKRAVMLGEHSVLYVAQEDVVDGKA